LGSSCAVEVQQKKKKETFELLKQLLLLCPHKNLPTQKHAKETGESHHRTVADITVPRPAERDESIHTHGGASHIWSLSTLAKEKSSGNLEFKAVYVR
jgi:hypothetical protein